MNEGKIERRGLGCEVGSGGKVIQEEEGRKENEEKVERLRKEKGSNLEEEGRSLCSGGG